MPPENYINKKCKTEKNITPIEENVKPTKEELSIFQTINGICDVARLKLVGHLADVAIQEKNNPKLQR